MDKSRKFSKFFKFFLSMALVLTVGFIPTVAKASESITSYVGPYSVSFERKWYGEWSYITHVPNDYYGNSMTFSYVDQFDHVETNARLKFVFLNVNFKKGMDSHFSSSFTFKAQGTDFDLISPDYFNNVYVYGRLDGYDYYKPIATNVSFYIQGQEVFMDIDYPGIDSVVDINVYVDFNVDTAFGSSPFIDGSGNFLLSIPESGFQIIYNGSGSLSVPSVDSPDINDFPDIDEYLPESGNSFMSVFSKFTSIPFVTTSLFIVTIVGVVSYVLFGRKS